MAAEAPSPGRQMSLIPFTGDSREVVLQRGNAVVLYDAQSRLLSVRQGSDDENTEPAVCPLCHQSLHERRPSSENRGYDPDYKSDRRFVDPEYFSMLAESQRPSPAGSGIVTPNGRVQLALRSGRSRDVSGSYSAPPAHSDSQTAGPSTSRGRGISSSAFSPGYFNQFFKEIAELGRGGNGVVLLVEHVIDDVPLGQFACKRIPVGDSRSHFERIIIEVRLLQKIPHRNLVAYHWTWLEDHQPAKFGPSIPCLWILQDYCNGGDLQSYVLGPSSDMSSNEALKARLRRKSRGEASPARATLGSSRLSFDEIFSFFKDITTGLHHLHSKGYIHRDLKPSNCLLQHDDGRTRVLISDFGEVQLAGDNRRSTGATGTVAYLAPEALRQSADGSFHNFTTKSDIFSLGMIVYFMCFGRLPYIHADGISEEDEDLDQLRAEITRWPGFDDETRPRSDLPERLYKYLKRLLSVNPDDRPGTDEILSSIKGGISLGDANIAQDDYNTRLPGMDHSARQSRRSPFLSAPGARPTSRAGGTNIDSRSPSPMKKQQASETDPLLPPETSTTLGLRQTLSNVPTLRRNDSAHPSPRLLLPPPPLTRQERYIQNVTRAVQQPAVLLTLRTGLFLAKVVSCVAPCSNNAVQPWLLYPLLMFAAIDLGEFHLPLRYSILLLLLHMAVVLVATRQDVLCVGG